jgi:Tol biopolymer transport system component
VWAPDGGTIAFATGRNGGVDIYQRKVGVTGDDDAVLRVNAIPILFPSDWSHDGKYLMYYRTDTKTRLDTWVLPLFGDRTPIKILGTPYNESQGQIAPGGKSFAFVSDESGQPQVYLQSFPSPTRQEQVSTGGGTQPRWRPDGRELFYLAPDGKIMAVSMRGNATLETDAPRPLFNTPLDSGALRQTYAVSPDGQAISVAGAVSLLVIDDDGRPQLARAFAALDDSQFPTPKTQFPTTPNSQFPRTPNS